MKLNFETWKKYISLNLSLPSDYVKSDFKEFTCTLYVQCIYVYMKNLEE